MFSFHEHEFRSDPIHVMSRDTTVMPSAVGVLCAIFCGRANISQTPPSDRSLSLALPVISKYAQFTSSYHNTQTAITALPYVRSTQRPSITPMSMISLMLFIFFSFRFSGVFLFTSRTFLRSFARSVSDFFILPISNVGQDVIYVKHVRHSKHTMI